ncbi:mediator of RNA polymerase II transcription subunit 15-like [Amphibalanus amphitrite]|uniref:mediator of RNA polymerase II transcription subunit 15-like n=1 Tax=Amphibalanus amphitrite TaxID=1232801 RepID=UPI001C90886D|nr:mediator of RNA polymerase II transcription subunit 15-like [Amphibalanus amphitrite]XP_043218314.1 mediator of RNA polymerase II transcription subunit 15-like [Amphibalanus amphitrite]
MAEDPNDWKSAASRMKAKQHIEEAIRQSGNPTNKTSREMENHVFQRAKTREEYIGFLGRLLLHINKYKQGGDPMNALQNMAGQQQQQQPQQQQQQMPPQMQQQQAGPPQDQAAMLSSMAARSQMMQPQPGPGMSALQMQQQQQQQHQAAAAAAAAAAQQQRMQTQMMMQGGGQMSMMMQGGGPMARQPPPSQQGMVGARGMVASPGGLAALTAKQQPSPAFAAPSPGSSCLGQSPMAPGSAKAPSQMSAPSPQLHTPAGPANATTSPRSQHDETQYMEKVKQLSKYIEPIKRMIENTNHQETAKLSKIKGLLEILENPNRQHPMDLLIKCEHVLEKLEINQASGMAHGHSQQQQQHTTHKEYQVILDTVNCFSKSAYLNHTLGRTVGPPYQALLGCTLRLPPARRLRGPPAAADPIPLPLQREVAGMEARFKVTLDSTCPPGGGGGVRLVVELDEPTAPAVPPVRLAVPSDYPARSPRCLHDGLAYSGTPFLRRVQHYLLSRLEKLPDHYTVSQLLHQWEMSVRQACAPSADAPPPPQQPVAAAN